MNQKYDFSKIEAKWQKKWQDSGIFKADNDSEKEKYYALDMFPYPSGEGLHVGHWRGLVLSDTLARYQLLKGKNVLHPMGWDAFGLPAENAAIKNKSHPKVFTDNAIKHFKNQIDQIGTIIDWSREINTSDPGYYKWTQWLFLKLYENKLAYRKNAPVNWCPSCQTVLANEQVTSGECERCSSKISKKDLTQWFFKITDFAEDLLKGLDDLDWPERTKLLQKNWIGKSEGALVKFQIISLVPKGKMEVEVFTTRADTLFGATYLVLAPEHEMVAKLKVKAENLLEIDKYLEVVKNKTEIERQSLDKVKTGVELKGIKALNPVNGQQIPVYIADYILLNYGTGAIMAVPAHDSRDFEFAKVFNLEIKQVISEDGKENILNEPYLASGVMINSDNYNGQDSQQAAKLIIDNLEKQGLARPETHYRLRDWLISRQRYWGAPIPMIYCEKCGEVPVPEKDLPVKLPDDVEFKPTGDSPLKLSETFLKTKCPKCHGPATRDTDTMDTFVDSSWYYLRYTDPNNDQEIAQNDKIKHWMPVDFYVGGIEHAILHLLYARFISYALHRLNIIDFGKSSEPFQKLFNIGMIYLHGAKMSKSKGNIVSPDEIVKKYGTDSLRGYELFIGPADQDSEWQVMGIAGIYRFIEKVWKYYQNVEVNNENVTDDEIETKISIITHEIEAIRPNTAISHLMELFNYLKTQKTLSKNYLDKINIILSPFFPHLSEELWAIRGFKTSIFNESWPSLNPEIKSKKITIVVQINGKMRDILMLEKELSKDEIVKLVKQNQKISVHLGNKNIKNIIYISGRILNFVVE